MPDLNEFTTNGFYIFNLNYNSTLIPANMPFSTYTGRLDILICYSSLNNDNYKVQVYYNNNTVTKEIIIYIRCFNGKTWQEWKAANKNLLDMVSKLNDYSLSAIKYCGTVTTANYNSLLPDLNNASGGFYIFNLNYNSTLIPANMPFSTYTGRLDILITYLNPDMYGYRRQVYYSYNKQTNNLNIYSRGGTSASSWDEWVQIDKYLIDNIKPYKGTLQASNYQSLLPDANGMITDGYYLLNFAFNSTDIPANLPITLYNGRIDILETYANPNGYKRQIYYNKTHDGLEIYSRGSSSSTGTDWDAWEKLYVNVGVTKIIVDKNGGADYTSLTEAMRKNLKRSVEFYVRPGEYDLIEEMKAYYDNSYFDNESFNDEGLVIRYGNKVFMDSNAVVKFNYEGTNQRVINYFSPFKFGYEGGELYGGQIICSNCRYAIHDDCYTSAYDNRITDGVYIYYRSSRNVAIGGGLGHSSHVDLRNCYVDSGNLGYGVFYHNSLVATDAKNFVSIHGNYFTSAIVIEPLGPSTEISKALVYNNKVLGGVRKSMPSVQDNPSNIDNFEMIDWNNVTL